MKSTKVQEAKAEWVRLAERADRLSGKARREAETRANEAFEAYVHASDDVPARVRRLAIPSLPILSAHSTP